MNYFGWTREEARRFMRENTLLRNGSVPMVVLERQVDEWIAADAPTPGLTPAPESPGGGGS